ncbi:MAG: GIY-YIG nuclease family protein, partial [Desulfobacterales bacterium]|nr:GIY-YIG nuclease family protein [Desulfobacterales bacterium]
GYLKERISSAPDSPGVYLMRDSRGKVIYVGKAISLRKRLSNYVLTVLGLYKCSTGIYLTPVF